MRDVRAVARIDLEFEGLLHRFLLFTSFDILETNNVTKLRLDHYIVVWCLSSKMGGVGNRVDVHLFHELEVSFVLFLAGKKSRTNRFAILSIVTYRNGLAKKFIGYVMQ
jgi:hypothetical protein